MKNTRLKDLLKAKGETCVSIIIPTHHFSHERRGDKIELKKAVRDAKDELIRHITYEQFQAYEAVIEEWVKEVDYTRNLEGLGMFLSPSVKKMVKFPFPVKEKVVVSDSFDDIIETMIEKGGEVYFTDNGQSEAYGKMVLIKHY